jgi:hypothetical protein
MPDLNAWPYFARPPEKLSVRETCPTCGRESPWWLPYQPLGETPGMYDPNHMAFGRPGAVRLGSGVQMRCRFCGTQAEYRLPPPEHKPLPPPPP